MANPYFNAAYYLANNHDVYVAGVDAETHYREFGANEAYAQGATNRAPAPWFDIEYYLSNNQDLFMAFAGNVAAAFDHFTEYGIAEGRAPSDDYHLTSDVLSTYAAENADLMDAFGIDDPNDLTPEQETQLAQHFYQFGWNEGRPGAPGGEPVVEGGQTYFLEVGQDTLTGTNSDDSFLAYAAQNNQGSVSNTLASGDFLDGKGGYDTLFAEIMPEFFGSSGLFHIDVMPRTKNIQQVEFEARDPANSWVGLNPELGGILGGLLGEGEFGNGHHGYFNYANNLIGNGLLDILPIESGVTVDAKHMYGVERIGSKQSDGDLVIENLTTLANDGVTKRNTSEMTITMDHTDNFNSDGDASDLIVLFDDNYLISGQQSEGHAFYYLLDMDADEAGLPLLDHINVDGIRFQIGDGDTVTLRADNADAANTHVEFVAALQDALTQLIADGTVPAGTTLTLDPTTTRTTYLDNGNISSAVPAIVLTSGDGSIVTPVGFQFLEDEPGEFNIWGRFDNEFEIEDQPVSVNIELTKVGRGHDGGNLIIGAKGLDNYYDYYDHGFHGQGIEVFDVTVMGGDHLPNSLGTLGTTNGGLKTVNISSEAALGRENYASLEIRDGFGQWALDRVDASTFMGDLALGTAARGGWWSGIENLTTLVATGGGDVEFWGDVWLPKNYSYTTGSGDDYLSVNIDPQNMYGSHTVNTVDTGVAINSGGGDDYVQVVMPFDSGSISNPSLDLMWHLRNMSITTGEGEDHVVNTGRATFQINTGSDSDFVHINTGNLNHLDIGNGGGTASNGGWLTGVVYGPFDNGMPEWQERVLYKATVTVDFAGFEQTVNIDTKAANNFVATQADINDAIIRAIDSNPELARLLDYELDFGDQELEIWSTVEGRNHLNIVVDQPGTVAATPVPANSVLLTGSDAQAVRKGLIETGVADSAALNTDANIAGVMTGISGNLDSLGNVGGIDYLVRNDGGSSNETGVINQSIINMGTGTNDLVVLGSDYSYLPGGSFGGNTLEFTEAWGKVSVVNFFTNNNGVPDYEGYARNHILDFSTYLVDVESTSGSPDSAVRIDGIGTWENANGINFTANQVAVVNDFVPDLVLNQTWAGLGASQLQSAISGSGGWGSGAGEILQANVPAWGGFNLINDEYNSIVLVENNANDGEYKAFHVTVSNVSGPESFAVELLGVIDFGYTIADSLGNPLYDLLVV